MIDKIKLQKENNSLKLQIETLKQTIKDELYKEFMDKLKEPAESKRLKEENKRLRAKNKELKEIIKEGIKND